MIKCWCLRAVRKFSDDYALFGLKIGYEGQRVTAYVETKNLSDEKYVSSASVSGNLNGADSAVFEPGTGRAVYSGISLKW